MTKPFLFFIFQVLSSFSISFFFFLANAHDINTLNSLTQEKPICLSQDILKETKHVKKHILVNLTGTLSFSHIHYLNNAEQINLNKPSFKFQQNYITPNLLDIYKPKKISSQAQKGSALIDEDLKDIIQKIKSLLEVPADSLNHHEDKIRNLANLIEEHYITRLPRKEIENFIRESRIQDLNHDEDAKKFYNFIINKPGSFKSLPLLKLAFKSEDLDKIQNELNIDVFKKVFDAIPGLNELNRTYYFDKTFSQATHIYNKYVVSGLSDAAYSSTIIKRTIELYINDAFNLYMSENPTNYSGPAYKPCLTDSKELLKFEERMLQYTYSYVLNNFNCIHGRAKINDESLPQNLLLYNKYVNAIKPVGSTHFESLVYNKRFKVMIMHALEYHLENINKEHPFLDNFEPCTDDFILDELNTCGFPSTAINKYKIQEHQIDSKEKLKHLRENNTLGFYNMFEPLKVAESDATKKVNLHSLLIDFSEQKKKALRDTVQQLRRELFFNSNKQLIKHNEFIFVESVDKIFAKIKKDNKLALPVISDEFLPYLSPCKFLHIENEYTRALIMQYLNSNTLIKANYDSSYSRSSSVL